MKKLVILVSALGATAVLAMAAYAAPKVLGLNGPGITGADCAHPFENPTPLSEFLQLLLFFSVIAGLPYYYGRMINHRWRAAGSCGLRLPC